MMTSFILSFVTLLVTSGIIISDAFVIKSTTNCKHRHSSRSNSNNEIESSISFLSMSNHSKEPTINKNNEHLSSQRRRFIQNTAILASSLSSSLLIIGGSSSAQIMKPQIANAGNFAPGGTLVDYEVGVNVGNNEASVSRDINNSNVIFSQDYYFKFGTAPQWIVDDTYPKTMPFVLSQQRYDAIKKYGSRVTSGVTYIDTSIKDAINNNDYNKVLDASSPEYQLRPMGLLANNFMASENTGTTNELLLARWYINETYLQINDVKKYLKDGNKSKATTAYVSTKKAVNSYLTMINRSITSKVGDKFDLLSL